MGLAPLSDFAVVSREEDFGDFHAAKIGGLGVLGVFKIVAVAKAFNFGGSGAAEDAGDEADEAVNNAEGGKFATGENEVAEGDLVINEGEDEGVVAFVMRAEEN